MNNIENTKTAPRFLLLLLLAALAPTAAAGLIQADVVVTINQTFAGFPGPKTFEMQYVFDTDVLEFSNATQRRYGLVSGTATVDGQTFSATGGNLTYQDQVPFVPPRDRVTGIGFYNFALGPVNILSLNLSLEGVQSIFAIDDLPLVPEPSEFFDQSFTAVFSGGSCGGTCAASGTPSSVTFSAVGEESVPAPAGWLMVAGGMIVVTLRRRRRPSV